MPQPKKLIEVAMPIKEISAESVRDKSIRHGHISTLHLWWARRPLPVCRAVVFASLVPDPEDENCPYAFKDAVKQLLGKQENNTDPYKPYDDIPYTSAIDKMEDTLRNRLMMFIGKFSEKYIQDAKQGKKAAAKHMLSDASLIKWDNKNDDTIIGKARKLIWVSHNASTGKSAKELLKDFDTDYKAIKDAETALYSLHDRHIETEKSKQLTDQLQNAIDAFQDKMPKVFDPFAGGGAIPLEAARLGCKTYGNDINPVAHIIQKGSLEFPQKYGKPITYSNAEFVKLYGEETLKTISNEWKTYTSGNATGVRIPNRLSFDVEFYAKKLLAETEKEIGYLYPADEKGNKPIAYYWARVGTCSNPSCKAEIPLLKGFYLNNIAQKQVYLKPVYNGKKIDFEIRNGICTEEGWNRRTNIFCPICNSVTDSKTLKKQFQNKTTKERLLAVIEKGINSKEYRLPTENELKIVELVPKVDKRPFKSKMQIGNNRNFNSPGWGIDDFVDMFTDRQLFALQSLISNTRKIQNASDHLEDDYKEGIMTFLGLLLDKIAAATTSFGRWNIGGEKIETPFSKQAIPMMFDYPEGYIFSGVTGSANNQLDWIIRYIESESNNSFSTILQNASSGEKNQFLGKYLTAVITDPPYYDAIAYADLSDFFYVWLKQTLIDVYPLNFATPQTPKSEECTALKHHHTNQEAARNHFEKKLTQIFDAIEYQTADIVSIMFAHQSTEAWTTLCNSILDSRMNITGSWPIDTEMANRSLGLSGAALASSVTVAAKPSQRTGYGEYKVVRKAIELTVAKEVEKLYRLGFRGADLLTACFGQAVSEFGKFEIVEKADGSEVTVAELLEMARESAFNALLKGFDGDDFTKFYIAWLQLYGFVESDFDDAAKFSRVGLSINVQELFTDHILIKNGNKQALGGYAERLAESKNLGEKTDSHLIDQVHRAMNLFKGANRGILLEYIHRVASNPDGSFWRVLTSICELLPDGSDDHKQAIGMIANKESLIRESNTIAKEKQEQTKLFE
jgi:adenine-specific DNA methylase